MAYDLTTDVGKVRLLINDVDATAEVFTDDEIRVYLNLEDDDIRRAAATALVTIAGNEALLAKHITSRGLSMSGPRVAEALMAQAQDLRAQADAAGDGTFLSADNADGYDFGRLRGW